MSVGVKEEPESPKAVRDRVVSLEPVVHARKWSDMNVVRLSHSISGYSTTKLFFFFLNSVIIIIIVLFYFWWVEYSEREVKKLWLPREQFFFEICKNVYEKL